MNDLVKLVRQQFPDDPRDDQRLTYELGQFAERERPEWLQQFPEFAAQYKDIQRFLRPSAWDEFKGSVGSAADNLQATTLGAGALVSKAVGADRMAAYLAEQAAEQERQAAEYTPSVGSYKDIESLGDAAYYAFYGLGQVVPSAAESAVLAGAGAALGTVAEPGGGTIAGGLAGLVAKKAAQNLIKAGVKDLTSELGKAALRKETKVVAARMLGQAGLAASTIPQSAGEIYNETGDVGISASMGTLAGLLDLLPESYVLSKFFTPGKAIAKAETSKVLGYVKRLGIEASKTIPMEGSTEAAQEFINWAAEKWARGEPASITDADVERFVNAGLIGAVGGAMFAPAAALPGGRVAPQPAQPSGNSGQLPADPFGPPAPTAYPGPIGPKVPGYDTPIGPRVPGYETPIGPPSPAQDAAQTFENAASQAERVRRSGAGAAALRSDLYAQQLAGNVGQGLTETEDTSGVSTPMDDYIAKVQRAVQAAAEAEQQAQEEAFAPPAPVAIPTPAVRPQPEVVNTPPPAAITQGPAEILAGSMPNPRSGVEAVPAPAPISVADVLPPADQQRVAEIEELQRKRWSEMQKPDSGEFVDDLVSSVKKARGFRQTFVFDLKDTQKVIAHIKNNPKWNDVLEGAEIVPYAGKQESMAGPRVASIIKNGKEIARVGFSDINGEFYLDGRAAEFDAIMQAHRIETRPGRILAEYDTTFTPEDVGLNPVALEPEANRIARNDPVIAKLESERQAILRRQTLYEAVELPTSPTVAAPSDLNGLAYIRDLRNQPLTPDERVASVFENAGRNLRESTSAVVILDRGTGRVHVKPVYRNKDQMVAWSQAKTKSVGRQGPARTLDLDAATEGTPVRNILNATLQDGSPRFEIIGESSYRAPEVAQPLVFNSLEEYQANPGVEPLVKAGLEVQAVRKRTTGRTIPKSKLVPFEAVEGAVSADTRAALATDEGAVGQRTRSLADIADEDAEAQGGGAATPAEPATEESREVTSRKIVTTLAVAIKDGATESDVRAMIKSEFKKRGVTQEWVKARNKNEGTNLTVEQLADYMVDAAKQMAEVMENLTRRATAGWRMGESERVALYNNLVDAIRASGGEVVVFQKNLAEGLAAWQQAIGFQLTQSDGLSLVGLALNSIESRDADAVIALTHETAHHFLEKLVPDPATRAKFQQAISQLPWQQQKWLMNPLSTDVRLIANADPATLSPYQKSILAALPADDVARMRLMAPDELLNEQATEHLAMLGVDRAQARGVVAQVIRAVKDLLLRVAMAVQRTLKGDGAVSDRLVRQFVENRWLQFINRDFAQGDQTISSLRNWIGAPATYRERTATYRNIGGDPRSGDLDVDTGLWRPTDFIPGTVEELVDKLQAAVVNYTVRATTQQSVHYTPEIQFNSEVAAINYLDESVSRIWDTLKAILPAKVLTSPDAKAAFLKEYMGLGNASMPESMRAAVAAKASTTVDPVTGQKIAFNPATQINQLTPVVAETTDAQGNLFKMQLASAQHYAMDASLSRLRDIQRRVQNWYAEGKDRVERLEKRKNLSEKERTELSDLKTDLHLYSRILNDDQTGLRWRIGELERRRGVSINEIFYPGAEYRVPGSTDADPNSFSAHTIPKDLRFNQRQKEEFIARLASMRKWLDNTANYKYGLEYNRMEQQWKRMNEHFSTEYVYSANTFNMRRSFTKSLGDMLRGVGSPVAVHAAKMFSLFQANVMQHNETGRTIGTHWSEAYNNLAKAMGRKLDESFREDVWDTLNRVLEQVNEGAPNAVELGRKILESHYGFTFTPKSFAALKDLVRETRRAQAWDRQVFESLALKVEDRAIGEGVQRNLRDLGYFNGRRTISRSLESLYLTMQQKWSPTDADGTAQDAPLTALAGNPAALKEYFTDRVIGDFVEPLVRGNSEFIALRIPNEGKGFRVDRQAKQDNVRAAWKLAKGDVVAFARELHRLEGRTDVGVEQTIDDVMAAFNAKFREVKLQIEKRLTAESNGMETMPRQMMDGRQAENWPPEWVSYSDYNSSSNHIFLTASAMNSAFGRNGFGPNGEFSMLIHAVREDLRNLAIEEEGLRKGGMPEEKVRAQMGADRYTIARQARNHLDMLDNLDKKLGAVTKTTGYMLADMRTVVDLLGLQQLLVMQNPRSTMVNTTDLIAPFWKTKFSTTSFKMVKDALSSFGNSITNSLGEAVGMDMERNADMAKRRKKVGGIDSAAYTTWKQRMADVRTKFSEPDHPESTYEKATRKLAVGIRGVREATEIGRNDAIPNSAPKAMSAKFRPFGIFSATSRMITDALVDSLYHSLNDLALRGVQLIERQGGERYAQELEAGRARLDPELLGYTRKWLFLNDRAAYDWLADTLTTKMTERSVEDFVVKAYRRSKAAQGGQWMAIDDNQFRNIANVATNELSIQANVASTPIDMMTNPALRLLTPFLVWPWNAMNRSIGSFKTPQGKFTPSSVADGMTLLMMGVVPATLAASLMVDLYDEKVVGKRSNIRELSWDDPMATMERLARFGTFGLLSEAVNGAINFEDARGGFTADNRIFIFSQWKNLNTMVGNLWQQEGEATYQSVGRPLMQFIGMNGVLQYTQIANKAFGLSNAEAQVNERINVGNYLRATGRALDLDVRISRSASAIPTPLTPYVQQMELAALTNDYPLFREAYARAIQQAAKMGKEDPAKSVAESFAERHPLRRIFRTLPSEQDYRNILSHLNEDGRQAVTRTVTSYNRYLTEYMHKKPVMGKVEKPGAALKPRVNPTITLEQARALAAQAVMDGF